MRQRAEERVNEQADQAGLSGAPDALEEHEGPIGSELAGPTFARRVLVQNPYSVDSAWLERARSWVAGCSKEELSERVRATIARDPTLAQKTLMAWLHASALRRGEGANDWRSLDPSLEPQWVELAQALGLRELERLYRALCRFYSVMARFRGSSKALQAVRQQVWSLCFGRNLPNALRTRDALQGIHVLVLGETGTGKEVVAEAIAAANLHDGAYAAVNCAALPEGVFESELFGHVRGAFSGAVEPREGLLVQADEGVMFFDEVADLSLASQNKLLSVLSNARVRPVGAKKSVKVSQRYVSATSRDFDALVEAGSVRSDFAHRIGKEIVTIPPLRERPEDISEIGAFFVAQLVASVGPEEEREILCTPVQAPRHLKDESSWTAEDIEADLHQWLATAALERPWRGNVRELEAVIRKRWATGRNERASERGEPIKPGVYRAEFEAPAAIVDATATMREVQQWYAARVLRHAQGNLTRAAGTLGVDRKTLRGWLSK